MLKRLGLGVLMLMLIAASEPKPDSKAKPPDAQATQEQRGTEQSPLVVETRPAPKTRDEAAADKRDANRQIDNDTRSFKLNLALILVGVLQLGVFGYQAVMLRRTVREGKDAIKAAVRAANATEASVEATISADQPYIMPTLPVVDHLFGQTLADKLYTTTAVNLPEIGFKFGNFGQSVAIIKGFRVEIIVGPLPERPIFTYSALYSGDIIVRTRGQTETQYFPFSRNFTAEEVDGIASGGMTIHAFGHVRYVDIYGHLHTKAFCFNIRLGRDRFNQLAGGPAYNYRKREKAPPDLVM